MLLSSLDLANQNMQRKWITGVRGARLDIWLFKDDDGHDCYNLFWHKRGSGTYYKSVLWVNALTAQCLIYDFTQGGNKSERTDQDQAAS